MPHLSRRSFVSAVLGAPAALALGPTTSAAASTRRRPARFSRTRFAAHRGRSFTLSSGGRRIPVKLLAVGDLPRARRGSADQFRVLFATARRGGPSEQRTVTLSRPGFGSVQLFVVPSRRRSTYVYEAVINRPAGIR